MRPERERDRFPTCGTVPTLTLATRGKRKAWFPLRAPLLRIPSDLPLMFLFVSLQFRSPNRKQAVNDITERWEFGIRSLFHLFN
jgi:hypothetical protein